MNAYYKTKRLSFKTTDAAAKHRLKWGLKSGVYDTNFYDLALGVNLVKIQLPADTEVFFAVTAIGATGLESAPSNEVAVVTPLQPAVPEPPVTPTEPEPPAPVAPPAPTEFIIELEFVANAPA